MNLKIKSLKTWNSPDGGGFECDLFVDDVKSAHVYNGGHGGPNDYRWTSSVIEETVAKFVRTVPKRKAYGSMLNVSLDWLVDEAINAFTKAREDAKILKRCLTETLFRTAKQGPDAYSRIKLPFTPEVRALCVAKYGAVEFLNETLAK